VPRSIKGELKDSIIQLSIKEINKDLRANLEKKVFRTSVDGVLMGAYSTNPTKNLSYVWEKFVKATSSSS